MIPKKKLKEIREYLLKAENPLFFYDDDPDGLCSYMLFRKLINKGKGVIVKSVPILDERFVRKVKEYSPDIVFVLDMPDVTQEFIDNVDVPIVWLDHHQPVKRKGVKYYNPRLKIPRDNKPTSYYAYKVVEQNLWIATLGTVSDWHRPDFAKQFMEHYPDLLQKKLKKPEELLFDSRIGELALLTSFLLKGPMKDVISSINVFSQIETPYEILDQTTPKGKLLFKRANKFRKEYKIMLEDALKTKSNGNLFIYYYPSQKNSFTSELSNELLYRKPKKVIIVARESEGYMKLSFRSSKIKLPKKINKALEGLDGYGGGHEFACGGKISSHDFDEFLERFKKLIKN